MQQHMLGTDLDGITRALGAFELYVEELERNAADPSDLERFVKLFERVVEPHCAREEGLLLAAMAVCGVAAGAEELSEARVWRHCARELLAALRAAGREARALNHPPSVTQRAREYIELVRSHLAWYRRVVRPLLESRLSAETLEEPLEADDAVVSDQAEIEALADELVEAYSERPTPVQPVP